MRICAAYGEKRPLRKGADMHEIRMDVFDSVPDGIGKDDIITLCGKDAGAIPASFKGLVDIGESDLNIPNRKIRSIHDYERTPSASEIVAMLSEGDQEISKGAFTVSSFSDLHSIFEASRHLQRRHLILGMGDLGMVTRIRQSLLKNEFTFASEGKATAPGQLTYDQMSSLNDDTVIVGITGHPLDHSLSPVMQNAAIRKAGLDALYLRFDSPSLGKMRETLIDYGIRGMNVTIPYKQDVMDQLDSVTEKSATIGAVNTIINENGKLFGDNTDVDGISYAVGDSTDCSILIMGSGGAARAALFAFMQKGCRTAVAGRNERAVSELCDTFGAERHAGDIGRYDIVVNCTPIGLVEGVYPADISGLNHDQKVFDMVYGRSTPLTEMARARSCELIDGKEMLIGQGAASFRKWFGIEPDMDAMRGAL